MGLFNSNTATLTGIGAPTTSCKTGIVDLAVFLPNNFYHTIQFSPATAKHKCLFLSLKQFVILQLMGLSKWRAPGRRKWWAVPQGLRSGGWGLCTDPNPDPRAGGVEAVLRGSGSGQ